MEPSPFAADILFLPESLVNGSTFRGVLFNTESAHKGITFWNSLAEWELFTQEHDESYYFAKGAYGQPTKYHDPSNVAAYWEAGKLWPTYLAEYSHSRPPFMAT